VKNRSLFLGLPLTIALTSGAFGAELDRLIELVYRKGYDQAPFRPELAEKLGVPPQTKAYQSSHGSGATVHFCAVYKKDQSGSWLIFLSTHDKHDAQGFLTDQDGRLAMFLRGHKDSDVWSWVTEPVEQGGSRFKLELQNWKDYEPTLASEPDRPAKH
jgi:hypothetical protein